MCCRSACRGADGHTNFEIGIGVTRHTMSPDISEKVILMSQEALIENAIEQIMGVWQVDAKDLRGRGPKGFDWLPGSHLVSVRAVPFDLNDPTYLTLNIMGATDPRQGGIRLSVTTRLIADFPSKNPKAVELLNVLAPTMSSTYSLVYPPRELLNQMNAPEGSFDLELFSSIYIDQNLAGWLPHFFAQMSIMHPIDAEFFGCRLPDIIGGGQPAFALGDKRDELDEILEVADQIFVPAGATQSRWAGSDEFDRFAQSFGKTEDCIANGDLSGLTAEVPFGRDTAIIQCWTDQAHPKLGNGLLVTMQLPFVDEEDQLTVAVEDLNFFEARAWTEVPQLGCWHTRKTATDRGKVAAHSMFVPNALYRPGLVQNFVLWEMARARWVRQTFFPELKDSYMTEIYKDRFG